LIITVVDSVIGRLQQLLQVLGSSYVALNKLLVTAYLTYQKSAGWQAGEGRAHGRPVLGRGLI
jgi:hypothetical protein